MKKFTQVKMNVALGMMLMIGSFVSAISVAAETMAEPETKKTSVTDRVLKKLVSLEKPVVAKVVAAPVAAPVAAAPKVAVVDKQDVATDTATVETEVKTAATKKGQQKSKKQPFSNYKLPDVSAEEAKAPGYDKKLRGRISNKTAYGIAVVYGSDPVLGERESWNDFNSKMKMNNFKKISELSEGDTVEIAYKQIIQSNKRILTGITLVHKLTKEERAAEEKALQDTPDESEISQKVAEVSQPAVKGLSNGTVKTL